MRRILPWLLFAAMIAGAAGVYAVQTWDPYRSIPRVTLSRLNEGEASWYARGILDYRVLVSVKFAAEQRRYEVFVQAGQFRAASSSGWDEESQAWEDFTQVSEEEGSLFTIPGMYSMMRSDLLSEEVEREVLRLEVGALGYPETMFLGRIIQDGAGVSGTELLIEVLEFEEQ